MGHDAGIRRHRITIAGRRVVFREAGAGAPLLIASGLGLSGRFYDRNLPALAAAGLRAIVPDLPGFGGTRGRRFGHTPAQACAFLCDFADALEIDRAIWVGHSVGAQAVLELAARAPHRARGLVLVGPTGDPRGGTPWQQARALALEALRAPPRVVLRVLADYVRTSPLEYLGTWIRYARDHTERVLPGVTAPLLVLVGDRDPVVHTDYIELLLRRARNARLQYVAGGTHALPRSSPEEFNAATIAFARELLRLPGRQA